VRLRSAGEPATPAGTMSACPVESRWANRRPFRRGLRPDCEGGGERGSPPWRPAFATGESLAPKSPPANWVDARLGNGGVSVGGQITYSSWLMEVPIHQE